MVSPIPEAIVVLRPYLPDKVAAGTLKKKDVSVPIQ
jgi:hypothetical protein